VLHGRVRTLGVHETRVEVMGSAFTMVDVGGQRSERRRWFPLFQDVNAIIFLTALDDYDKVLEEDNKTNRFIESLNLFEQLSGLQWFVQTPFIVFFNKSDLFREKLLRSPLNTFFVGISEEDGVIFDAALAFLQKKFQAAFKGRALYMYVTCAIDTENCKKVFLAVKDMLLMAHIDAL